jgi:transcriptional regulatory protein LevR
MGSLVNIVSIFSENFGIKARTIDRVDLLAVLEGVRKAFISENDLDSI